MIGINNIQRATSGPDTPDRQSFLIATFRTPAVETASSVLTSIRTLFPMVLFILSRRVLSCRVPEFDFWSMISAFQWQPPATRRRYTNERHGEDTASSDCRGGVTSDNGLGSEHEPHCWHLERVSLSQRNSPLYRDHDFSLGRYSDRIRHCGYELSCITR